MKSADTHHKLLDRASLISTMTLASRILGMIRDVVCAAIFGTGFVWDAFIYAFTFPNFLRRVLGEGALASVFIPVYTETVNKKGKPAAEHLANTMLTLVFLGVGLLVIVVLCFLWLLLKAAPLDARALLTVKLSMIVFPYIIFLSQYGIAMSVLNCRGHFFTPAFAPVLFNILWIASALWVVPKFSQDPQTQVTVLSFCVLAAGLLQFLLQLIPLRRDGFRLKFSLDFKNEGVKRIFRLFLPAVFGFGIMQVNILFDRTLATFLGEGANSSLWYSNRLIQFPIGLTSIALGTALLPQLSEQITQGKSGDASRLLSFSLRTVFVLVIPASVGLVAMREPIFRVLFQRGAFDAVSTLRSSRTLLAYAIGLFAYSGSNLLVTAFYASKDTRTPVRVAGVCMIFDIVTNIILMFPLKEVGLALTTSLSGILNFSMLIFFLARNKLKFEGREISITFIKSFLASLMSAWVLIRIAAWMGGLEAGSVAGFVKLLLIIGVGIFSYVLFGLLLRISEIQYLLGFFAKRFYGTGRANSSTSS